MGLGVTELVIILVIIIILFGVGRLGRIGGELGEAIGNFRRGIQDSNEAKEETAEEKS